MSLRCEDVIELRYPHLLARSPLPKPVPCAALVATRMCYQGEHAER